MTPPYKLTRSKQKEYPYINFRTLVLARALTRWIFRKDMINFGNVIIWDEILQYSLEQLTERLNSSRRHMQPGRAMVSHWRTATETASTYRRNMYFGFAEAERP